MRFQLWLPPRQMYRRRASTTGDISRPEIRRSQSQQMWVKAYAEDGFVIVPNLQGADTLDRLRQAMGRIMKDPKGVPEDLRHKIVGSVNSDPFHSGNSEPSGDSRKR